MPEDVRMMVDDDELFDVAGGASGYRYKYYTIVRGDTLTKIAHRYNTTVDELVRINHIPDKDRIYAGDKILVPVRVVY